MNYCKALDDTTICSFVCTRCNNCMSNGVCTAARYDNRLCYCEDDEVQPSEYAEWQDYFNGDDNPNDYVNYI